MPDLIPQIVKNDPWLDPFKDIIANRQVKATEREKSLISTFDSLVDFANGYRFFGMHFEGEEWIFREWAPNATRIFIVGEFGETAAFYEHICLYNFKFICKISS